MPVMMTSSGECCRAREGFFASLFDFFVSGQRDLRGFMNWIVASKCSLRFPFLDCRIRQVSDIPSRRSQSKSEIQIVYRARWQVSYGVMKKFEELTEREVLALAIALEEEDERVYADFAEGLRQDYPATASMFDGMREEESGHRRRLLELFQKKFGEHIPLIRRQDVRGFVDRPALWLVRPLRIEAVRKEASTMEVETRRFYEKAAARTQDASIRQLLDDLARKSASTKSAPRNSTSKNCPDNVKADEEVAQRRLVRAADCAARAGGTDGWIGLDAGAGIRGGLCHHNSSDGVSGGSGRFGRRGHQHGIRRGAFG